MNDLTFRLLAIAIFVIGAGISSYYRIKAERASDENISVRDEGTLLSLTLRVFGLLLWVAILAYLINPTWMAWSRVDLPDGLRWAGVVLGIAADVLAYWVFSSLGYNVTPTVVTRKNATLVTHGPYRYVRHPLYLMGLISYAGFALLSENALIALLALVTFILLNVRLPKEEARLVERFGDDYRAYMRRTGRFLPKISQFSKDSLTQ